MLYTPKTEFIAKPSIEVSIVPPEEIIQTPKRQIVTTPEKAPEAKEVPKTNFESDKDLFVPQESVKKGDPGNALPRAPTTNSQPSPQSPKSEPAPQKPATKAEKVSTSDQKTSPQKNGAQKQPNAELQPKNPPKESAEDLDGEFKKPTESKRPPDKLVLKLDGSTAEKLFQNEQPKASERTHVQPFSRPQGSGAQFLGDGGTRDFLPNLPDGDMTLLNAKANQYAVFVRRVAEQVFAELRTVGWAQLSQGDIKAINDAVTITATMNLSGQLTGIKLTSPSGSPPFDGALNMAVKRGVKDSNPPVSAALQDKLIHFTFESRSWSAVVPDPRSKGIVERRWLYLGTGLE